MADLSGTQYEGGGNWQTGYLKTRTNIVSWAGLADANTDGVLTMHAGEVLVGVAAKVLAGGDKVSTLELGLAGDDTDGFITEFGVEAADVGNESYGNGALMGGLPFVMDTVLSVRSVVTDGPNTEEVQVKFMALYAKIEI